MTPGSTPVKFRAVWAVLFVLKLVLAATLPLFGDEAFYWQEGRHLAWAYSDLPGFTAWLARLGVAVGGTHPLGLRWPFLLIGAALPWVAVRLARREFGDEAGWQAGLLVLALPLAGWLGTLALPDAPLVLAALLALDAVSALLRRVEPGALAELAVALVVGGLTHYRFGFVVLAGGVGLLLLPRGRALLRQPAFLAVVALGALAWAPVLLWNRAHAGSGFAFQVLERNPWHLHAGGLLWPLVQAAVVTPGLFVLAWATLGRQWTAWRRDHDDGAGLFLGAGGIAVLAWCVLAFFADRERVSFHWPLAGWIALLCAAPPVFAAWSARGRAIAWGLAVAGHLVLLAVLVAYSLPAARAGLADSRAYPDNFAGWREIADAVRAARADLPQGTPVVTDNFMLGAQLGFALDEPDLAVLDHPLNHKHGRAPQLRDWGLERRARGDLGTGPVLLVVEDTARPLKARLAGYHALCDTVGPLPRPQVVEVDHGRKRFLLFRLPATAASTACITPALAWIDRPALGAAVHGPVVVEGWAFKDGVGIDAVDVTLDGAVVARAAYGHAMPHVAAYWKVSTDPRQPDVGFRATFDTAGVAPGMHWLGLRLHGADGSVEDWPQQRLVVR
jgi:hypothetical protein